MMDETSYAKDHYFGGFDERASPFSGLQPHLFGSVGGDECGNLLLADRQPNLGQQTAVLHFQDAPDQLVAAADLAEIHAARFDVAMTQLSWKQAVDFAFGDAVVASRRLHRLDLSVVDPLLQGWIADTQNTRCFPRRQEPLHERPPMNRQNTA